MIKIKEIWTLSMTGFTTALLITIGIPTALLILILGIRASITIGVIAAVYMFCKYITFRLRRKAMASDIKTLFKAGQTPSQIKGVLKLKYNIDDKTITNLFEERIFNIIKG